MEYLRILYLSINKENLLFLDIFRIFIIYLPICDIKDRFTKTYFYNKELTECERKILN